MNFYENLYHIYYDDVKAALLDQGCTDPTEDQINAAIIENVILDVVKANKDNIR